jgi:aspartyl-tRNA(Asn)/glutamyl-tRNA(Gln) amidotransferase subunit A
MIDIANLNIKEINKKLLAGEFTAVDLANYFLEKIADKNGELHAFLEVYNDVLDQAKIADEKIKSGNATLLTGIPIAIKDNILFNGKIASASSKILENYTATYDATVIKKLRDVGAVLIGRTNMDEFAMGGSTENSAYGLTKNPLDTNRVAGGSSGGSAVAVAGDLCVVALGSDTGGSIRQPASFCGVFGLKPTYGSVSRYGLMAMASSLDVIGPITKNIIDSEIVFDFIKGRDVHDSTSVDGDSGDGLVKKIGVPQKYLESLIGGGQTEGIDSDVLENYKKSIEKLAGQDYEIIDISDDLKNLEHSLAVYYVIMPAEVSSNMARYDGIKYGSNIEGENLIDGYFKTRGNLIGKEVKRRILLGTYVLSAGYADQYYAKAWQVRNLIKQDFANAFKKVDVIAIPTSPTPAFKIGEKSNDPLQMYLADIFTVFANLVGVPAISIPDGFVEREGKKLPTGLQLVAPHLQEKRLFNLGKSF